LILKLALLDIELLIEAPLPDFQHWEWLQVVDTFPRRAFHSFLSRSAAIFIAFAFAFWPKPSQFIGESTIQRGPAE